MTSAKRLSLLWSAEAEQDLVDVWEYLASNVSETSADRQLLAIGDTGERLRHMPYLGRERADLHPELRSIGTGPYLLFYRVSGDSIEVVRVIHGRRDLEALFSDQPGS